ncbi:MAG: hypothetical protein K1X67_25570, partial [Fimbriimonadaceae bacterium]|nr:hypothetical protein [Fimbriimonadaceae bacterium]
MSNPVNDRQTSAVVSAFLRRFVKDGGYTANPYRQWYRHVGSEIIQIWDVGFERTNNPKEPSDVVVQHEVASLELLAVQATEPADFFSPHISLACLEMIGPKPGLHDSDVILKPPLRPEHLEDYCDALECAMVTMEMLHESIQTTEDLIQYR